MSTFFDQRGQHVTYQYNAAGNINFGKVENRAGFVQQMEALEGDLSKAIEARVVPEEAATDASYELKKAIQEAKKPEPSKTSILDRLATLKKVIAGVAGVAGMVSGIEKAIEVAHHLF